MKKDYHVMSVLLLTLLTLSVSAQTFVNKEWAVSGAHPVGLEWHRSILDANNQLVTIGNTATQNQGANLLLQKFDENGNLLWQSSYNSAGSNPDYGIAVTTDVANNIYVCGTTTSNGQQDILALKYNADGIQQWAVQYNSPANRNDVATTLKTDPVGNVYIAAISEGTATMSDFLLLKFNSDGLNLWQKRYDYAHLFEIPAALEFDDGGNILVIGASATDFNNWDFTIISYSSDGILQNAVRHNVAGAGFDQPIAAKKDASGNLYVVGKAATNGINYNIKTVKFNPNLSVAWVRTFDGNGLEDEAKEIAVDNSGNVFVAGHSTKINGLKELTVLKYDTDGNLGWVHKQASNNDSGDALAKSLDVDDTGKLYLIGEEKGTSGSKDVVAMKLSQTGKVEWMQHLDGTSDEMPSTIRLDAHHNIYLSAIETDGTIATYKTVKYTEFQPNPAILRDPAGKPIARKHQLIVRFDETMVNRAAVDGTLTTGEKRFGALDYFLQPQALNAVQLKLHKFCSSLTLHNQPTFCPITVSKIFPQLKTTDTVTTSRLGETIPIPAFWATFMFHFPENFDIREIQDSLSTLFPIIIYCEPNYLGHLDASANDSLYGIKQASLHPATLLPLFNPAHINVEPAWDIEVGKNTVKVGIFDTGLDWKHEDLGYDGLRDTSSRMVNGWDFEDMRPLRSLADPDYQGHGTAVAGIIGAVRNNQKGIAGIAGGNFLTRQKGVALYGMRVNSNGGGFFENNIIPSLDYFADAVVTSSIASTDTLKKYAYGLHIMNFSLGFDENSAFQYRRAYDTNLILMREAFHFANRAKVTCVVARGNEGYNSRQLPAIIDDDWILCVGGTGTNGKFANNDSIAGTQNCNFTPNSGWEIDVASPACDVLIQTLKTRGGYRDFDGTSAATPHVSGAAGLLMSYLNSPTASYYNLAPEDVEHILEKTATDIGPTGVDSTTGYGRLNVGGALRGVRKPCWRIDHFGTSANSRAFRTSVYSNRDTILLDERYRNSNGVWFGRGRYVVKTYKIEATINHNLPTTDNIMDYWARSSSSTVLQLFDRTKKLQPRERAFVETINQSSAKVYGYAYQVWDESNRYLGWWPSDTLVTTPVLEYTIWVRDTRQCTTAASDVSSNNLQTAKVYPNPTSDEQTLQLVSNKADVLEIQLLDVSGRFIQSVFKGQSQVGQNQYVINLSTFANGFYIYRIQNGRTVTYVKTIKN